MSAKHTAIFLRRFAWALSALAGAFGLVWLWFNQPVILGIWFALAVPFFLIGMACLHMGRDEP